MNALPSDICSPQDLTALILEIREYAKWYEHESIKRRTGSSLQSTPPVLTLTAATYLRSLNQEGAVTPDKLEKTIEALESYKASAPSITFTLAAPATEQVKKQLTSWVRSNLSPETLVSFEHNRTLLGGIVVRYGSHVHDWSVRRELVNTSVNFSEVLANV